MGAEKINEQIAKLDAAISTTKKRIALLQSRTKENSEFLSVVSKIRNLTAQIEDLPPSPEREQFDDRESFEDAWQGPLRVENGRIHQ